MIISIIKKLKLYFHKNEINVFHEKMKMAIDDLIILFKDYDIESAMDILFAMSSNEDPDLRKYYQAILNFYGYKTDKNYRTFTKESIIKGFELDKENLIDGLFDHF